MVRGKAGGAQASPALFYGSYLGMNGEACTHCHGKDVNNDNTGGASRCGNARAAFEVKGLSGSSCNQQEESCLVIPDDSHSSSVVSSKMCLCSGLGGRDAL